MDNIVDVTWLEENLDDPNLRILDCSVIMEQAADGSYSFVSGQKVWSEGHILGSVFADLTSALSDTTSPLPFTLPSVEQFAEVMSALGVGTESKVILYDRSENMWATRVWWMLRAFSFDNAAVLNGGWTAWSKANAPITTDEPNFPSVNFPAKLRKGVFVNTDEVLNSIKDSNVSLINVLPPEVFSGEIVPFARAGRIPQSINIPPMELLDTQTMRFADDATMRERFEVLSKKQSKPIIAYCGAGISSTAAAFLLHRLGYEDVAVYDGSLAEWSANEALPMVSD
jgi:thiosulfate/3-mercaptopyruvate sulfurtransferase